MSLEDFDLIELVGQGSFGQVHKVVRKTDNLIYALKQTSLQLSQVQMLGSAYNEIQVLSSTIHPNVIGFREAFYDAAAMMLCLVMEYSSAGNLQDQMKRLVKMRSYYQEADIWSMLEQILEGIRAIHGMGVVHQDIKPTNILLVGDSAKLCDFNSCRILDQQGTSMEIGTPLYASPEAWDGEACTTKSDVWCFGLRSPFKGATSQEISQKVRSGVYSRIPLRYTNKLSSFIAKCLYVDSERRAGVEELLGIVAGVRHGKSNPLSGINGPRCSLMSPMRIPESLVDLDRVLPASRYQIEPQSQYQIRRAFRQSWSADTKANETLQPLSTQLKCLQSLGLVLSPQTLKWGLQSAQSLCYQTRTQLKILTYYRTQKSQAETTRAPKGTNLHNVKSQSTLRKGRAARNPGTVGRQQAKKPKPKPKPK